jgi:hypothetical protein
MQFTTFLLTLAAATVINAHPFGVPRAANLQTFTGSLGGAATPVLDSGDAKRPFSVKGDTFVNLSAALQRSCDQQFNACANKANGGDKTISVADCTSQKGELCFSFYTLSFPYPNVLHNGKRTCIYFWASG